VKDATVPDVPAARRRGLVRTALLCAALSCAGVPPIVSPQAAAFDPADPAKPAPPVPEPDGYRMDEFRKPTPATLKGAHVINNDEALQLWTAKTAVFIDVYPYAPKPANLPAGTLWREPVHHTIEDAVWLANTGYGVMSPETEAYFKSHLETLSGGHKDKPLVFFCLRNCWMSWNAAKRALGYGYTYVSWYRDGSDGWQEIGGFLDEVRPLP